MKFTDAVIVTALVASAAAAEVCVPYEDPVCQTIQNEGLSCEILGGWADCSDYTWGLYYQLEDAAGKLTGEYSSIKKRAARDLLEYVRHHYW